MKFRAKVFIAILVFALAIGSLCACIPDKLEKVEIYLIKDGNFREQLYIGEYAVVSQIRNTNSTEYEVKAGDQEGLLDLFRKHERFIGEFEVVKFAVFGNDTLGIFEGQKAIWLKDGEDVWTVRTVGPKRVKARRIGEVMIRNVDNTIVAEVSAAVFMTSQANYRFGVEYASSLNWSQFKSFYSSSQVNEDEMSITIQCSYRELTTDMFSNNATTKLYFDDTNNTFSISANYTVTQE